MESVAESLTFPRYRELIERLPFGKKLPTAVYALDGEGYPFPSELKELVRTLRERVAAGPEFNVLKFATDRLSLSFLCYPGFFQEPHPAIEMAIAVDLAAGKVRRTGYQGAPNPPILHRKEALLPEGHPSFAQFRALSMREEAEGLYRDTAVIGFRANWERLLQSKGLAYDGHRLVQVTPVSDLKADGQRLTRKIERHKTAISRPEFSKPVKTLLDYGLLGQNDSFLDFGCGLGDDVRGLRELGYKAVGWDPYYAPQADRTPSNVVNLGFVVNVIEDPAERVETLQHAWGYAQCLLVVSTLMTGRECQYGHVEPYSDGVVTNRNTFQKHFGATEFLSFIEDALHAEAIPVEPGVAYVFRRLEDHQDFVARRTKRTIDWVSISQRLRFVHARAPRLSLYERHRELLDDFWLAMLEYGRPPRSGEYARYEEVSRACGSGNRASRVLIDKYGAEPMDEARERRKEDLVVFLSGGEFQKRRPGFQRLSSRLRTDVKAFFGNYASACDEARELLFMAGDPGELELAVEELEFGWCDSQEGHFTVHTSLLDQLPPLLRIYVECGARLYGDPRQADLIKLHLRSKKLTLLHYDNFLGEPLPALEMRIKIDLRQLFVNVIDHTVGPEHQILFFKERYLAPDHLGRDKFEAFSKRLRKLGIHEGLLGSNDRNAPSKEAFERFLLRAGLTKGLARRPQ